MSLKKFSILLAVILLFVACDERTPTVPTPDEVLYQLNLSSNRDVIYADNGTTTADISAYLTDDSGIPLSGVSVQFWASQGTMAANRTTNPSGRATTIFDDGGVPGDSVRIVAQYTDGTSIVRDTIYIQVLPMSALVDTFFIATDLQYGIMEVDSLSQSESVTISAFVWDANSVPVENVEVNYTVVHNENGLGYLLSASDSTNQSGESTTEFITNPGRLGTATIQASVSEASIQKLVRLNPGVYEFGSLGKGSNANGMLFSAEVDIQVVAGSEYVLDVQTQDPVIYADGGTTQARINAILRNVAGQAIANVPISFLSTLGTINGVKETNEAGVAAVLFSDLGTSFTQDSTVTIYAEWEHPFHGLIHDSTTVRVELVTPPAEANYTLELASLNDFVYADNGVTTTQVYAIVRNDSGTAQPGMSVTFSTSAGTITGQVTTTEMGVAEATFSDIGSTATENVTAVIAATVEDPNYPGVVAASGSMEIEIRLPEDNTTRNFYLTSIPYSGVVPITNTDSSYVGEIRAHVRDNDGAALEGVSVHFSNTASSGTELGYLTASNVVTDSSGTAIAYFTVNPGQWGEATIEASVVGDDGIAPLTKVLSFVPLTDWEIRAFTMNEFIYFDGGASVATVYAVARDVEGNPLDSVRVRFSSDVGTVASPSFTDNSGVATSTFSDIGASGPGPVVANVYMRVEHPFYGYRRDTVQVTIQDNDVNPPKIPAYVNLTSQFSEVPPLGSPDTTYSRLTVFVADSNGFAVDEDTEITFETNIGDVTPFTLTDENGMASALFTIGDSSGIAKVYAYCGTAMDSVFIQVRPLGASYIVIPPANPSSIIVQGGWGQQSTTVRAYVRDARGDFVDSSYAVNFSIGPAPTGANLDGQGTSVVKYTNHGVASATLNAGTQSGTVQLTVSTQKPDGTTIHSTTNVATIRAGLPAHINADLDMQDFTPIGAGFYEIEVAATVWDLHTNPVEDSTQVYWYIIPDSICDIVGESYTNNENLAGDSYHGIAWSKLYFNSGEIFDDIQIIAQTWGRSDSNGNPDTVMAIINEDADSTQIIPFYPGTLTVTPSISFHDFGTGGSPVDVTLMANLIDFYNNPIQGGRILFQAVGGAAWIEVGGYPILPDGSVQTDAQGIAMITVRFDQALCVPNFDAGGENVVSYDPFTALVWGILIDPNSVTSEQMVIELRRSIPE